MMRTKLVPCAAVTLGAAFAALLLWVGPTWATDDGGTQSPFAVGSGAREQAMGRAATALSHGPEALFWNSARLANNQRSELSLYRSQLFVDGSMFHSGFVAYPTMDLGTLAIGYQRIQVTDIERRDERNRLLGSFSNGEANMLVGYGRQLSGAMSFGAALRIVQQSVDTASDVGIGLDLGFDASRAVGHTGLHRLGFGVNLQNALEPTVRLLHEDVEDPRNLKLGLGYQGRASGQPFAWAAGFDLDIARKADIRSGIGLEVLYREALAMRLGLDESRPTFGIGLQWRGFRFDYALRSDGELPRNDRLGLTLQFGTSVGIRRQERLNRQRQRVAAELQQLLEQRENQELARALDGADGAFAARQWDEAVFLYRRVLALDPTHEHARQRADAVDIHQKLVAAAELLDGRQPAQAAAIYQTILDKRPREQRAVDGLSRARAIMHRAANRDSAIRDLFAEALSRFGDGDLAGAEATLAELLRIDANHELGREMQARVAHTREERGNAKLAEARKLAQAGRWDAALAELRQVRRVLGERGDLAALEAGWKQRLQQEVSSEEPTAVAAERSGAGAQQQLSAEQRRGLEREYRDGLAAFTSGDFQRAIHSWRSVWQADPSYENVGDYLIKAYLFEGVELYGRGRYDDAIERCERVLEIDPEHDKARRYLERIVEEKTEIEQIGGRAHE